MRLTNELIDTIWSGTRSGQALFGQDYLTPDLRQGSSFGVSALWSGLPDLGVSTHSEGARAGGKVNADRRY